MIEQDSLSQMSLIPIEVEESDIRSNTEVQSQQTEEQSNGLNVPLNVQSPRTTSNVVVLSDGRVGWMSVCDNLTLTEADDLLHGHDISARDEFSTDLGNRPCVGSSHSNFIRISYFVNSRRIKLIKENHHHRTVIRYNCLHPIIHSFL